MTVSQQMDALMALKELIIQKQFVLRRMTFVCLHAVTMATLCLLDLSSAISVITLYPGDHLQVIYALAAFIL